MDKKMISIGEAELEIMKVIWKAGEPVNSITISQAVEKWNWKRTTIATFLTRLTEKGALAAEKRGKLYYYTPLITAKEYRRMQTKKMLKNLYNGSVKDFAVALFEDEQLSDSEIQELRAIFDDTEE